MGLNLEALGPLSSGERAWLAELGLGGGFVASPERFAELVSEPQNVLDTVDTVYGTPHYTAPESLLAAGWGPAQLRLLEESEGDWEGWVVRGGADDAPLVLLDGLPPDQPR